MDCTRSPARSGTATSSSTWRPGGSPPPPLREQIPGLSERLQRFAMGSLRRARRISYDVKANWKLVVENYSECYHCPLIHPDLNRVTHYLTGENDLVSENFNGGYQVIGDDYCTLTVEGKQTRPHFKGLRPEDHNRVYYYTLYPNFLLSLHPDYMMTHTLWPRGPKETHIVCDWHFDPEVMDQPGFTADDAVEFWDMTNRQDWRACELTQMGVASRVYAPGPVSLQEDFLYTFDHFVERKLQEPSGPRRVAGEA
jgi:phenylpropionate dioxygenase-like ring-hydroxylating dioxygenase large terminal subunit